MEELENFKEQISSKRHQEILKKDDDELLNILKIFLQCKK